MADRPDSGILLFPNPATVRHLSAFSMANARDMWHEAPALSFEICRGITPTLAQRSGRPLALPLAGSHHPFCRYRFTTILATLVMTHEEDTSKQKSGQERPFIRRDKVVVTKVTEQELAQIKSSAGQCGMTRSDFIRARALGYRPRRRLSEVELDGLRQLAACRTDMINFANALHGLTDDEKVRLFRHRPTMLEWYEKVAAVTDRVTDFLQSAQSANNYPAGTTDRPDKEDDA